MRQTLLQIAITTMLLLSSALPVSLSLTRRVTAPLRDPVKAAEAVGEVTEDVCQTLAPRAHENGLDLILDIRDDVHRSVHGDVTRVRQVLVNLVGNAVKFTMSGAVTVRASIVDTGASAQTVRFESRTDRTRWRQ